MAKPGYFPTDFTERAIIYASHTHKLGDRASIILAQAALESGWFSSKLWLQGKNPFGLQKARRKENQTFQTGEPVPLAGGVLHAGYAEISDAFRDRERVIKQHAAQHPGKDIWERFELAWAPRDPKYPSNEGYSAKLQRIIKEYGLERYDTKHPPPRKDLDPTEPYVATDPRDNYHNLPGVNSDRPRPGLPYWLVGLLLLLVAFLSGQAAGATGGGWLGTVIAALRQLAGGVG